MRRTLLLMFVAGVSVAASAQQGTSEMRGRDVTSNVDGTRILPNISSSSAGSDSININGMASYNSNYLLDEANNADDFNGPSSGTQARTPPESIQEFPVITHQFDAEFGRTSNRTAPRMLQLGMRLEF